jgi:signal peptidase II
MKRNIYLIACIGIFIDQITKIISNLYLENIVIIKNFFNLTYVENTGAAWGILDNNRIILIGVSIIAVLFINKYINSETEVNKLTITSYGMVLGGILGNLLDRIFRGYVIDFLNFNILGYDFPVFNIADTLIVAGIILMFVEVIRGSYGSKSRKK